MRDERYLVPSSGTEYYSVVPVLSIVEPLLVSNNEHYVAMLEQELAPRTSHLAPELIYSSIILTTIERLIIVEGVGWTTIYNALFGQFHRICFKTCWHCYNNEISPAALWAINPVRRDERD